MAGLEAPLEQSVNCLVIGRHGQASVAAAVCTEMQGETRMDSRSTLAGSNLELSVGANEQDEK